MLCTVSGCKNANRPNYKDKSANVRYYSFPKDQDLLTKWVEFCKRKDAFDLQFARICGDHFSANDFERNMRFEMGFTKKNVPKLKPGAVPSVYKEAISSSKNAKQLNADSGSKDVSAKQNEEYAEKIKKLQQENFRLKLNEEKLHKAIKSLHIQLTKSQYANKNMETRLKTIFTDAQINKLKTGGKRVQWSEADIAKSLLLYSAGSRAYKMLKRDKFPLPSVRTLQRWTQKSDPKIVNLEVDILEEETQMSAVEEESALGCDHQMVNNNEQRQHSENNFKGFDYGDHSYVSLKYSA